MGEEKQFTHRNAILLGFFALCLAVFWGLLYEAQVVDYEEHLAKSTTHVTISEPVESSRGILTDRNGKILVSNREIYTLTFNPNLIPEQEEESHGATVARTLLRLLLLCREYDVEWTDNLPIAPLPPYAYEITTSSTYRSRFQRYLSEQGWSDTELDEPVLSPTATPALQLTLGDSYLSSTQLLDLMREHYAIPENFSAEEARLVMGVLYELELRTMDSNYYVPPYVMAEDISVELISLLNDGNFLGSVVDSQSVRQYNTDYAAHILGRIGDISDQEERAALNADYLAAKEAGEDLSGLHYYANDDKVGKEGAEKAFESYLRGKDGTRIITTNEEGKITSELYSIEPEPGDTVSLTIDIDFQTKVEQALAETVQAMNAEDGSVSRGAAAAVVDVSDSGVLALASYPTYNLSTYSQDYAANLENPAKPFTNKAISGTYAPGSTFKMVTSVAALEAGIVTPSTKIRDMGRYTYWSDYQPACWIYRQGGGTHGPINVSQAIYHSCNYYFYEVGRLMGIDTLNAYASAFGLGQDTGLELGGRTGILDGPEYRSDAGSYWVGGDILQCSIGQGNNLFTPLQLANYIATLVRGGDRYNTHLLHNVTSYDGSKTLSAYEAETVATVEMSDSTLAAVKKGMGDLVSTGSISKYFQECVVSAGAKTGSAQTGEAVANGVFVCFAPFDEPEVAVAIVIEQGGSGAALASTAVNILNAYFSPSDIGAALVPEGALLP